MSAPDRRRKLLDLRLWPKRHRQSWFRRGFRYETSRKPLISPKWGRLAVTYVFPNLSTASALKNRSTTSLMPSSGVNVTIVMPSVAFVRVSPSE